MVTEGESHFLFATMDPWGGDHLALWESRDFKNWTFQPLNWPSKAACSSTTSSDAKVWAPSVVKGRDGKFWMYFSVGSEVWVGSAAAPGGPWSDANGGKPLIPGNFRPGYHMIDAEAFIDDDGRAYLYWGSGLNWVNGKCWVVALKEDMVTFDGTVKDVTPSNYFEAPFMIKHGGRYYLSYSSGKTTEDTYQVHYAISSSPMGPFEEGKGSPILSTDKDRNILSPGHHALFEKDGRHFILYHRHSIPFDPSFVGRQVCVDEIKFNQDGTIEKVVPTHDAPKFVRRPDLPKIEMSSSEPRSEKTRAGFAYDNNYATLWAAAKGSQTAWLQMELGAHPRKIHRTQIRFEYPWKIPSFTLSASDNSKEWKPIAEFPHPSSGASPVTLEVELEARFLRLNFAEIRSGEEPGVFEWHAE